MLNLVVPPQPEDQMDARVVVLVIVLVIAVVITQAAINASRRGLTHQVLIVERVVNARQVCAADRHFGACNLCNNANHWTRGGNGCFVKNVVR
jgi:hypothetical protein